jgi:hypothetical protein
MFPGTVPTQRTRDERTCRIKARDNALNNTPARPVVRSASVVVSLFVNL